MHRHRCLSSITPSQDYTILRGQRILWFKKFSVWYLPGLVSGTRSMHQSATKCVYPENSKDLLLNVVRGQSGNLQSATPGGLSMATCVQSSAIVLCRACMPHMSFICCQTLYTDRMVHINCRIRLHIYTPVQARPLPGWICGAWWQMAPTLTAYCKRTPPFGCTGGQAALADQGYCTAEGATQNPVRRTLCDKPINSLVSLNTSRDSTALLPCPFCLPAREFQRLIQLGYSTQLQMMDPPIPAAAGSAAAWEATRGAVEAQSWSAPGAEVRGCRASQLVMRSTKYGSTSHVSKLNYATVLQPDRGWHVVA